MPSGGLLAIFCNAWEREFRDELIHFSVALGGGALLSAVALVLVPHGIEALSTPNVALLFLTGAVVFLLLDRWIQARGSSKSQLLAMLLDFIPEAIALGATIGSGVGGGVLLALLIAVQNLPEGFNAFRELDISIHSSKKVLLAFCLLAFLGPIAAVIGIVFFANRPSLLAGLMLIASGGILYLTFQDIAPQARLKGHWAPPLGAVVGFLIGVIGQMVIGE